jgi:hypothetical protein
MTFKSDDYNKLDRNHTRARMTLQQIDAARKFNRLKFVEDITIVAYDKDGEKIELKASNNLKNALAEAGAAFCIDLARILQAEPIEAADLERAASV